MTKKHGVLDVVTDKFSLKNHARSDGNNRNYLLESVKAMFNSPLVKERLKLGEIMGYFGHNRRAMAGKLDLDETEIVYRDGKPVVMDNVPACRTIDVSVDDDGIVTHTQEILDTPSGRAVKAMIDASAGGVGGWSWAVGGVQTIKGAIAKTFHGFDFVNHPSYVSLNKQAMLLESTGAKNQDDLLSMMFESQGFDAGQSHKILSMLEKNQVSYDEYNELTQDVLMLESIVSDRDEQIKKFVVTQENRSQLLLEAIGNSPIIMTDEQKQALINLDSENDVSVLKPFFESLALARTDLPLKSSNTVSVKQNKSIDPLINDYVVKFSNKPNNPFQIK